MNLLIGGMALALAVTAWVIHPMIFRRWGLLGDGSTADAVDREARRRVALAALKDVEYDRAAGKLDEQDYREIRGRLEAEALRAVRAADADSGSARRKSHTCGFANPSDSRFCAGCGQPLT
ncbi:MAG: zinc ribbon domain-containing protein [Gemmatimonadota bacterium]|jgi:hypothetical protein|nr:zinc ribbon domain-containing protein [Gemmatimonadota bacterium]